GWKRQSLEREVIADKAVEAGDAVVKRARGGVVLLCRPIEPCAAALAGNCGNRFDQPGPAPLPPGRSIDKQILQVADLAGHPGMGVKEIVGDADERRRGIAEPRAEPADWALRGNQTLPS